LVVIVVRATLFGGLVEILDTVEVAGLLVACEGNVVAFGDLGGGVQVGERPTRLRLLGSFVVLNYFQFQFLLFVVARKGSIFGLIFDE